MNIGGGGARSRYDVSQMQWKPNYFPLFRFEWLIDPALLPGDTLRQSENSGELHVPKVYAIMYPLPNPRSAEEEEKSRKGVKMKYSRYEEKDQARLREKFSGENFGELTKWLGKVFRGGFLMQDYREFTLDGETYSVTKNGMGDKGMLIMKTDDGWGQFVGFETLANYVRDNRGPLPEWLSPYQQKEDYVEWEEE